MLTGLGRTHAWVRVHKARLRVHRVRVRVHRAWVRIQVHGAWVRVWTQTRPLSSSPSPDSLQHWVKGTYSKINFLKTGKFSHRCLIRSEYLKMCISSGSNLRKQCVWYLMLQSKFPRKGFLWLMNYIYFQNAISYTNFLIIYDLPCGTKSRFCIKGRDWIGTGAVSLRTSVSLHYVKGLFVW